MNTNARSTGAHNILHLLTVHGKLVIMVMELMAVAAMGMLLLVVGHLQQSTTLLCKRRQSREVQPPINRDK